MKLVNLKYFYTGMDKYKNTLINIIFLLYKNETHKKENLRWALRGTTLFTLLNTFLGVSEAVLPSMYYKVKL